MALYLGPDVGFGIGDGDNGKLIRVWVARILSEKRHWKEAWCPAEEAFEYPELLECMGLDQPRIRKRRTPPPEVRQQAEERLENAWAEDRAWRNLSRLGQHLGLSEPEVRIMTLAYHMEFSSLLPVACGLVRRSSRKKVVHMLSRLAELPVDAVAAALSMDSLMNQLELININSGGRAADLDDTFNFHGDLGRIISREELDDSALMSHFFRPGDQASLNRDDFIHHERDLQVILALLGNALRERRQGVNILLYGSPGTGKTELAYLLAQELDARLAVVPETNNEGETIDSQSRVKRLTGCHRALANQRDTLLLFDEAEDVICSPGFSLFGFSHASVATKASLNRLLESNETPVIWISNNTEAVDPAYIRRFSYALELDLPGPGQRESTLKKVLEPHPVAEETINRMAQNPHVSPALVDSAIRAAAATGVGSSEFEPVMVRTLENHLKAMGAARIERPDRRSSLPWRADCLNADQNMAALLDQLDPEVGVRFCLYGPPGTGKTAWGRQLAKNLGRPLMVRQASDLMSCYVGETEKLIARAFEQAEQDNAVLLIDEADSFLDDRQQARVSWEITQVNQFLASMERFDGYLVCTTNFDSRMDVAAMRRFDFRVGFDYLTLAMAVRLFGDLCELAETDRPDDETLADWLVGMHHLAPGDFNVLARRLRIHRKTPTAAELLGQLKQEAAYKETDNPGIGFNAEIH